MNLRRFGRPRLVIVFLVGGLVLGGAGVALARLAAPVGKARLERAVRDACPNCGFEIKDFVIRGLRVRARGVTFFRGAEGDHQQLRVLIDVVEIQPAWLDLLMGHVHLARVILTAPQVTLVETAGGRHTPDPAGGRGDEDSADDPAASPYAVDQITAVDGTFTYERNQGGTHAVLMLRNIGLTVGAFGSTPGLRAAETPASADLQLGFSGHVRLDVVARAYAPRTYADVTLAITDQNLKDLDAFFAPNAGVHVAGRLVEARATSLLRGRALATEVRAVFDEFDIAVTETKDRGAWDAFFTNLGIAVGIKRSNSELSAADQTRTLKSRRRGGESLVGFLLRGVKEAAISIAKKPAARALTE